MIYNLGLDWIKLSFNISSHIKLKPNFLIAGAGRAGSSFLFDCLKQHPDIFLSIDKEPSYFSLYYDLGEQWYLNHFKSIKHYPIVGEASTQYFYIKKATKRIYQFNPNFKLIFILRNPIERTFSNYKREIQVWGESRSFEDVLKKDNRYLHASMYYIHLSRFLQYFPRKQIHIIIFEKFIKNIDKYLEEICYFLEIDPKFKFDLTRVTQNPSKMPISLKLQKLNKRIFYFNRRESLLLQTFRLGGRTVIDSINHISYNSRKFPKMSNRTKNYLKEYFSDEIFKLEKLINENLSIWK